jgi:murein DD-endopeptidase MepM/ murein hydrolase activator NlpD
MVEAELRETQKRLDVEHDALVALRGRLRRSLNVLSNRLVEMYKADDPDMLTVLLESDGFADLIERFEYLQRIEESDSIIVDRVRTLRNDTEDTVVRIRAARDEIAAKEAELERTRVALEDQEAQLEAARADRQELLDDVEGHIRKLEGDIGDLQGEIQQQLSGTTATLPAGPIQAGSGGMIWPVNGPVTSPFGWRWGRMHEGVDIAVSAGTPIRAAKAGVVALAAPTGGYGNYTCVNHGGGLSSCYAHQSSYAVGVGDSVGQGEVIGNVGCTGSCFGDHLHFEVRVNGSAVDPMGYL